MFISLLGFACLVGAAFAGPYQREVAGRCATHCPKISDEKFNYESGHKYIYNYRGINYVTVAGGRKQQKAEISGKVEIHVVDKCEMALQLRNIRIDSEMPEEEKSDLIEKLEGTSLPFAWQDGQIDHVCASSQESKTSENIKKGILSAIINTMDDLRIPSSHKEVDSLGTCETKYLPSRQDSNTFRIQKEKALKSCDNRHSGVTALITNPYDSPDSDIRSLPIFSEEQLECVQEIRDRVLKHVVCKEHAVIRPLSKHHSIVEFEGELELSLERKEQSYGVPHPRDTEKRSMLYSYDQEQSVDSKEKEAREILSELCPKTESLLDPSVSKLYYRLIMTLKGLPESSVQSLYDSLKRREICHSPKTMDIFLDSLPMAGTEGALAVMVKLLQSKEITGLKAKLWPASLALIPHPNAEAISAVVPLISGEEKSRPVLLGLSAMIYRICSSSDCDQIPSVRQVVTILKRSLGPHCSGENEDEVISLLKAFGNMGYLGTAEETILECAKSSEKPISVRLAAIDAFRRSLKERPSALMELYSRASENSEVRIAALRCAMKDFDPSDLRIIQKVMSHEEDEQVAAYTMSLVHNLNETSSPLRQEHKKMLQETRIKHQDVGYWENSKNIEFSAFNAPINVGALFESDIVHAPGSKLPRSVSSRLDVDLFGSNINLFEFGVRAEGLETAAKKLFGMDELKHRQRSWFSMSSEHSDEVEHPKASFYARTMGTEFFDMSVSDLTSMPNMMQFADIMNKLAQGEKADMAHSFLFLNTKLIIPSVTGRSYSFGMTGSATVGLSADGKFDIVNLMSNPRNCHVQGRFQPSANVELTATVGIQSDKFRPDVKVVTSFHTESDAEIKFRIKDGHVVEASCAMPSEKLDLLKFSTDLYEVDSQNNEKRIFEEMEPKMDRCTSFLKKPLGIELCGKIETPRSTDSSSYPYAKGLGNVELVLKKSDPAMRGYELTLELPKHKSDVMKYQLKIDTPGSSINRQFLSKLELKKSASGENEFKMDIQSPFKSLSTSGSYTLRQDLVQGAIQVVTDNSRLYSMKAVTEISSSGSEKTIKPTLQWSSPESEPVTVTGSITYNRGRKERVMIDLKSNKPGAKPYVLTGNLMREGRFGLSANDEWKMSSDLVAKTPILTTKFRSSLGKQAGRSQSLHSSFSLDYEKERSKKESIKFTSEIQRNSAKLSSSASFEMTQSPKCNWFLNLDMQGRPSDEMKSDLMLKYGRNPERTYIQISQMSKRGEENSLSENKISVKAPQFFIDSDLNVKADVDYKRNSKIHLESDLRYKSDKHIKTLIQFEHLSKKPLKMAVKVLLEYPGRKMMYKDEIKESSPHTYEGRSILQWQENKQAALQYRYKAMSDRATTHHEIRSTLQAPFLRSPVTHISSFMSTRESLEAKTSIEQGNRPKYFIEAKLNRKGVSVISLNAPVLEGKLEVTNEDLKKSANLDMLVKLSSPRHILAKTVLELSSRKSLEAEIAWDASRKPSHKLSFSSRFDIISKRSQSSFDIGSKLQLLDILAVEISSTGENGFKGPAKLTFDISGRNIEPVTLIANHEITASGEKFDCHCSLAYKKHGSEKAKIELHGKMLKLRSGSEMHAKASIKSHDNTFESKELSLHHTYSHSHSSVSLDSSIRLQNAPNKVYEAAITVSNQAGQSTDIKISAKTPYRRFPHQEITISRSSSDNSHALECLVKYSGKQLAVSSVLKNTNRGYSWSCSLTSPFASVSDAKLYAAYDNQRSRIHAESHLEVNSERKYDASWSLMSTSVSKEMQTTLKTVITPEISVTCKSENDAQSFSYEVSIKKDSANVFASRISKRASGDDFTYSFDAENSKHSLMDVKVIKESQGTSAKYVLKAKGPFTPVAITLQSTKSDENSISLSLSACRELSERECYNLKGYYKQEENSNKYRKYRKFSVDVEKLSGQSSVTHLCNVHYLLSVQEKLIKSKFFIDAQNKRIGYDITARERRSMEEPCEFDASLLLPSRTVRITVSALHNIQQTAFDLEVIPDASAPSEKLVIEAKKREKSNGLAQDGHIRLSHPSLQKPISLEFSVQNSESRWPISGKVELDYSKDSGKKLIAEMMVVSEDEHRGIEKRTTVNRLYRQDGTLDITFKLLNEHSSAGDLYGCECSWKVNRGHNHRGVIITLSDRNSNEPFTLNATYISPSQNFTVLGRSLWTTCYPSEAHLELLSHGVSQGEILYKKEDSCFDVEFRRSGPLWRNHLCLKESEKRELESVLFTCYYQERKCLDLSVGLNPSETHFADIAINWEKNVLHDALEHLKSVMPLLSRSSWKQLSRDAIEKCRSLISSFKTKVMKPMTSMFESKLPEILEKILKELKINEEKVKEILEKLKREIVIPSRELFDRYLRQIAEASEKYMRKLSEFCDENMPESLKTLCEQIKKIYEKWLSKYCSRGSTCHELRSAYHRRGIRQVRRLLSAKYDDMKKTSSMRLMEVTKWIPSREDLIRWGEDLIKKVRSWLPTLQDYPVVRRIIERYEKVSELVERKYTEYYEKLMDIINKYKDQATNSSEFQAVASYVKNWMREAKTTWRQIKLKNALKPLQKAVFEEYPRTWIRDKVAIQNFDIPGGKVRLQLHHPLDNAKMQLLKNALFVVKSRYQSRS